MRTQLISRLLSNKVISICWFALLYIVFENQLVILWGLFNVAHGRGSSLLFLAPSLIYTFSISAIFLSLINQRPIKIYQLALCGVAVLLMISLDLVTGLVDIINRNIGIVVSTIALLIYRASPEAISFIERMRRIPYLIWSIFYSILASVIGFAIAAAISYSRYDIYSFADAMSVSMAATTFLWLGLVPPVQRLNDISRSKWWLVLSIIPIANVMLGIYLLFCPSGKVVGNDEDSKRFVNDSSSKEETEITHIPHVSMEIRLQQLAELKSKGLVSETVFAQKQSDILKNL